MNKIKFSHNYEKLKNIKVDEPVVLIEALFVNTKDLTDEFKTYDAQYLTEDGVSFYDLKDMDALILIFIDVHGNIFTTIRRQTPSKNEYYLTSIGSKFQVVINKGE